MKLELTSRILLIALAVGFSASFVVEDASAAAPVQRGKKRKQEERERPEVEGERFDFQDERLSFTFFGFDEFEERAVKGGDGQLGRWRAKLGPSDIDIDFWVMPTEKHDFTRPESVLARVHRERNKDAKKNKQVPFEFQETQALAGSFGFTSYAWVGIHTTYLDTKPVETQVVLCGLLEDQGYTLEFTAKPALIKENRERLFEFLRQGVWYDGETRDVEWSEEETVVRWERDMPARVQKQDKLGIIRTDHYIIFTNMRAKGGTAKSFGKHMEKCYEEIREVFPFEDVPGETLLPVFLFKTVENYRHFLVETLGQSPEQARRSGGVAYGDVYVTSFEAKTDPVHIHEATHQIFRNRLRLGGGGSWFQEGVAEYIEGPANLRKMFRQRAKKGRTTPLHEFMALPSLLYSTEVGVKGGNEAGNHYRQAACVIEFARESRWGKGKFQDFIHKVGRVPRGDLEAIEQALIEVYGVGIDGFEEEFVKYWKKR